ncbi:hypothetical protein TraAM80_08425 [Trypanosoma rangeli]|uniref:Uncharacterized protein n=1 Tax=Trypanosoma rangeli TaxID=5698 RepID=A0A422N0S3_TRYRA|nr:uncharacterized protein TraAM80_08425 [Trypanosoma rangeli]RNE99050.1 hypothetical protein TraAM80_08425 [Trypanosoma rangeli]|eukprot:RNE99050.1 hypothetical protein TraAM80_08425 [Trypanosoma rangeli]
MRGRGKPTEAEYMLRRCGMHRRTAFVTDVEGNLSYFIRYTDQSKVVSWTNGHLTFRDSTSHFVYGGDVFDHGDDITFAKALLDFRDAYPTRVHLILGNRDLNKMVFGAPIRQVLVDAAQLSPEAAQMLVFPVALSKFSDCTKCLSYAKYLEENGLPPVVTKTTFIQWLLTYKMGAPTAFERRRKELQQMRSSGEPVADAEVAQSFMDAAYPGGVYYEYLKHGKIAEVLDGILFVHGSVVDQNAGILPQRHASVGGATLPQCNVMMKHATADEWLDALNDFKEVEFRQWASGGDGALLREYAFPVSLVPHSVVVHALVEPDGPHYLGLGVVEFLNRSGIAIVCGGHLPAGDTPSIVQQPGLLRIAADNSYCAGDGSRGESIVEVLFEEDGGVCIHGRRADGMPFKFLATEPLLGRHLGDAWWVKAKVGVDRFEVQRTHDAYRTKETQIILADEVEARLRQWREPPVGGSAPERWSKQQLAPTPRLVKVKRNGLQKETNKTDSR